ncbi:MAG: glutamate racemase [Bacteroidia bacterium]|nr:glutamate racemase [Bacteroidia bacterium]
MAIGVFDSGIGGLTVASAIKQHHPNQQIIYFGDTAHLPYGEKSADHIKRYIKAISAFLFSNGCDQLVVACNSASSVLDDMEALPNFSSITNVIDPVINAIQKHRTIKRVGVIGTKRTIDSGVYVERLKARRPDLEVHTLATPLLAPMIEEGFIRNDIAKHTIHEYLSELPEVDALILGCTHYPLIKNEINAFFGGDVQLFDAPELVAQSLHVNQANNSKDGVDVFYVSDHTSSFEETAHRFFGSSLRLRKSDLFEY